MATHPAMTLTCLGTSDAFGTAGRHCAGYLVETATARVLLDAGPSVLGALHRLGKTSEGVQAVVLSHLHGDHFGGVPFLFLEATFERPRSEPLTIVGPPGTEARVFELYRALYADAGRDPLSFPVHFVEIDDRDVHEVGGLRFEAFGVPHVRTGRSLGLRVRVGDRCLCYSGDTAWTPDLLRQSSGADLFLCECTSFETPIPGHVLYRDIEGNRTRFECRELLLTHAGREMRARSGELCDRLADDGVVATIAG